MSLELETTVNTLIWQPSNSTLIAAAVVDVLLFGWAVAMLAANWIVVKISNCGVPDLYLFINEFCEENPSYHGRKECTWYDSSDAKDLPPGEELYTWRAIQAAVAICFAASFIVFALLCAGTRAPARKDADDTSCCSFDKRKCQEACIALCVILVAFSLTVLGVLYTSKSYDAGEWEDSLEKEYGVACDVKVHPGPAVGFAFLAAIWSIVTLGVLSCPGCHCLGFHEPGRCCAHCVDQTDAEGTSSYV